MSDNSQSHTPQVAAKVEPVADARVEQELTAMLLSNGATGGFAVVLGAALMAPMLGQAEYRHLYVPWLGYMAISALARGLAVHQFGKRPGNIQNWQRWRAIYGSLSVAIGLGWGAAPLLFLATLGPTGQAYLLIIMIGVTAAAIPLLSAHRGIYFGYIFPVLASQVFMLSIAQDRTSISLAAVLVIFLGLLMSSVTRVHNALRSALVLKFTNLDLINSLQTEKEAVEVLNSELLKENVARQLAQERLEVHRDGLEAEVEVRTRALTDAKNAAVAANKAKNDFLATISHEIRTPMNGIIGTTDLLLRTSLEDKQLALAQTCKASAGNLLSLINELLDFSKIEAGHLDIELQAVQLPELCAELRNLFAAELSRKGLVLDVDLGNTLPEWVEIDRKRLRQILLNLLGNALKFTQRGTLSLRVTSALPQTLRFEVADTGPGMTQETQNLVFSPFVQADSSMTRKHEGTGLGLAISSRLVELMGGEIGVESVLGEGSCFWFTLPAPTTQAPQNKTAVQPSAERRSLNLKLLVAEDNLVNQMIIEAMLQTLGCSCDIAQDGAEAVTMWNENEYDAILMDLSMPVVDGYEATVRIRAQEKSTHSANTTAIIALTAHALEQDRSKCISIGMNGFVTKPMTLEELESALKEAVPR